jgi:hypothetical protein
MKIPPAKRLAPAILAICISGSGLGLTAGTASASTTTTIHHTTSTTMHTGAPVKVGTSCTKAELNKTEKSGNTVLVCKRHLRKYKWEIKTSVTTTTGM